MLGRSFLATGRAFVEMEKEKIKFRLNNEEMTLNICRSMRKSGELQSISAISYRFEELSEVQIEKRQGVEALAVVIINYDSDGIKEYGSLAAAIVRGNICFKPKKFEIDM